MCFIFTNVCFTELQAGKQHGKPTLPRPILGLLLCSVQNNTYSALYTSGLAYSEPTL